MKRSSPSTGVGWLAIAGLLGVALLAPTSASATKPDPGHKVTICHATNSDTNPYVEETVDIASSGYLQGGHDTHGGPIWDDTLKDLHIQWGDIIPPYTYGEFAYPGRNWTDAGRAILEGGCIIPTRTEPPGEEPSGSIQSQLPSVTPASATPFGSVEAETGAVEASPTLPTTDTIGDPRAPTSSGWRLVLIALAGILAASLVIVPAARRR